MIERRLWLALGAGFVALTCGILAVVLDLTVLGVIAGVAGVGASVAAAAIAARSRAVSEVLDAAREERRQLRRELDALAAVFAEETARRRSTDRAPEPEPERSAVRPPREPVFDPVSGLLDQQFFPVIVQQRVAAARRQLQPVSIVLFELDGLDDAEAEVREQALGVLGDVVRRTLRECDTACRLTVSRAAAVLEDTAESGAAWAAERVRGTLHGSPVGDALTISAGIACYPSHALSSGELMEMANRALDAARRRGHDHVEIAQAD